MTTNISAHQLIGTWQLVKHGIVSKTGDFTPTAHIMAGFLTYTVEQTVHVLILKKIEPVLSSDLLTYLGTYTVENEGIYHHIVLCGDPKRIFSKELRIPTLKEDTLTLTTVKTEQGYFQAVWKKVNLGTTKPLFFEQS